jgi:hypothetical protein
MNNRNLMNQLKVRLLSVLLLTCLGSINTHAAIVDLYYKKSLPQSAFAASEIQQALEANNHSVELKPLSSLKSESTNPRIILALAEDRALTETLIAQGSDIPSHLGEQAYALRTTTEPALTYWVTGGDANGLMYGGLQLAENISSKNLEEKYHSQEAPHIKNRGVKYNLPLDARLPTYYGHRFKPHTEVFNGDGAKEAIPHVWDMSYWEDWFDEMARNRFNVISIWNCHPFPGLLDMEESVQDVQGFNGFSKKMSTAEKVEFWKQLMAYGKGRGFKIYFITWNIYTYGAAQQNGINNDPKNEATKAYFRKAVRMMFETYPDLDGIGVTAGENFEKLSDDEEGKWMWETYGQGMLDYAKEHPERDLTFIHRWHYATIEQVINNFKPLLALPNVRLDMSYKYSAAHMYSTPQPTLIYTMHGDVPKDLAKNDKKTWLEVRQDDFYYLHWGDPKFARAHIQGFPDKDRYIQGFFYGSDGMSATRDFVSKDPVFQGELDIKRLWYSQMLWGRLAYNPATPNSVFIDEMAVRYPEVSAAKLFEAWSYASRGVPLATEVIQGTLCFDFHWWPELCQGNKRFVTIEAFIKAKPPGGSDIISIADTVASKRTEGRTTYEVADEIETSATAALKRLSSLSAGDNAELAVHLKSITAQAWLSLYYAEKIRGATALAADKKDVAKTAMGKAVGHWRKYVTIMDSMFYGADMMRSKNFKNWHVNDDAVLKEYIALGGIAGRIADTSGSPLDGVEISSNGEAVKTKSDGHYIWPNPATDTGTIELSFAKLGYESQTVSIDTTDTTRDALNIQLISNGDPLAAYKISKVTIEAEALSIIEDKWGDAFIHAEHPQQFLDNIITLKPGDNIQDAINAANAAGGGVVYLTEGRYETDDLKLQSKVTLSGAGRDKTIVTHTGKGNFMDQGAPKLTDVIFKDLTLLGGGNTGSGLNLRGDNDDRHERFMWQNVTIKNVGSHGIGISRVNHIIMDNSVFQYNGTKGGLHHNVYFLFVGHVLQSDCDMSYPKEGKANKYTSTRHLLTQRCVMKVGKENGIQADNDQGGYLFFHKHHLSGFDKVAMWFPCEEYYNKFEYTEDPKWVPQNVILNRCEVVNSTWGAMWRVVGGQSFVINSVFDNEKIDMGLLKCDVVFEGSTFETGNQEYTDVKQWPEDVELLW